LGLHQVVVPTSAGAVPVRLAPRTGSTAIILLHGAAGSWTTWVPLLDAAARGGTPMPDVVAPDLPGWGGSAGPVPSRAGLARVVAEVAGHVGYDRWILVGHSLGAAVALDVAASHPEATAGVVLVAASGAGVRDAARRPVRGGVRLPWFAGMRAAMAVLRALGPAAPPLLRGLRRTRMLRLLARPLFAGRRAVVPDAADSLADEIRPGAFLAAVAASADGGEAAWRRIHCPVVSVRGAHDVFSRADDDADLAARIPGVATVVLPDAGHFAHMERPDAVLAALREVAAGDAARARDAGRS
jgi:pimeloyl-ACP methyl ester carboxylesterase